MVDNVTGAPLPGPTSLSGPNAHVSDGGWTFGTLIELIKAWFETVYKVLAERQMAVDRAFEDFKRWMAGTNEWRSTFEDLLKTRVSQEAFDALAARVKRIEDEETRGRGKTASFSQIGTILTTAICTAAAVIGSLAVFSQ